jgi:hypothetical protein
MPKRIEDSKKDQAGGAQDAKQHGENGEHLIESSFVWEQMAPVSEPALRRKGQGEKGSSDTAADDK